MSKNIIVTGATGLIGKKLCSDLISRGDYLTIFTRNIANAKKEVPGAKEYVEWNFHNPGDWEHHLERKDAVIHLAGANLFGKRWSDEFKKKILDSRIISSQNLVKAISKAKDKPTSFISSSAVGIYGDCGDEAIIEEHSAGNDFLAKVCENWESEVDKAQNYEVRTAKIRTGIVLSPEGGALKQMLPTFKMFVGGSLGNGKQWFPWIHIDDIIRIYFFALDNTIAKGAINAAAPNPVTMKDFASSLGKVLNRPSFFSVPEFAIKIAIGEAAETITTSLKVIPQKLLDSGYKFKFENVEDALKDLLQD